MKRIFVTGISTDVGKTIASAIITEALEADYWKPIQAGDLEHSDSHKIKELISNKKTVVHQNSYALKTPMSPHAAAEIDNLIIDIAQIIEPQTTNHLVIEGAGGLMVPLNEEDTILDIIKEHYQVIVVSRHYLGSINHSLLTIESLKQKGFNVAVIFSGNEHPSTEGIIIRKTGVKVLGRIEEETNFDKHLIKQYAAKFYPMLKTL
ncbi:dethiobiotin synthase [uncultured Eudoraea sp.]|jgi:dethiobiotin synthetase|uniref:dethiobiotin synthase n=1 Tax=uncultured Eudoraea sp. TaxID=1035614 RepID=UPI0026178951|nr:dethiobiotin synthase [uncultured Eudoraea sp.]